MLRRAGWSVTYLPPRFRLLGADAFSCFFNWSLRRSLSQKDASVIERLRTAGAILLGKSNLTEWAGGGGRNGYSTRGGQTVNPYDQARTLLGSSSGSGVAVGANLATVGLGTETMGSVLAPSALLGVVGVKPTVGLVSRTGIVPVALSMDSVGPMTRTVTDSAHLLNVLAAPDPDDVATSARPVSTDYVKALVPNLAGLRIGVVPEPSAQEASNALFDRVLNDLEGLGAVLVDGVELPAVTGTSFADHLEMMLTELKEQLPVYFHRVAEPSRCGRLPTSLTPTSALAIIGPFPPLSSLCDIRHRSTRRRLSFGGQRFPLA